jgi:hypothetical protein
MILLFEVAVREESKSQATQSEPETIEDPAVSSHPGRRAQPERSGLSCKAYASSRIDAVTRRSPLGRADRAALTRSSAVDPLPMSPRLISQGIGPVHDSALP